MEKQKTKNQKQYKILLAIGLALGLFACQDENTEVGAPSQIDDQVVAEVDFGKMGNVLFVEVEPGQLIIDATVKSHDLLPPDNLDPVESYTFLSGQPAPQALKEAYQRTLAIKDVAQAAEAAEVLVAPEQSGLQTELTGSQFEASYCPSSAWDYGYCWLNVTGKASVTRRVYSMYTYANPYRGRITHTLRYKKRLGGWELYRTKSVLEDDISYIRHTGSTRQREVEVTNASGDGYHLAIYGSD